MLDDQHVKAGVWAIDTANPNAWPATLEYLKGTMADVILTQEVKKREGDEVAGAEGSARGAKWNLAIEPCLVTTRDGNSAGVAVGARSHIGVSSPMTAAANDLKEHQGRFLIKRIGAMCKGGVHCGSIYCKHGVGILAKANLDFLQGVAGSSSDWWAPGSSVAIGTAPLPSLRSRGGSNSTRAKSLRQRPTPATGRSTTSSS